MIAIMVSFSLCTNVNAKTPIDCSKRYDNNENQIIKDFGMKIEKGKKSNNYKITVNKKQGILHPGFLQQLNTIPH